MLHDDDERETDSGGTKRPARRRPESDDS